MTQQCRRNRVHISRLRPNQRHYKYSICFATVILLVHHWVSNHEYTGVQGYSASHRFNRKQIHLTKKKRTELFRQSIATLRYWPSALQMCQLLGMNCARPTDFVFSFTGFAQRGGITDKHSDGWGLAFYEGRGIRAFHDSLPAAHSPIAALMKEYPCKTLNMLSHIRYATVGAVALENVHPFQREMWGISWCFAHNGDLPKFGSHNAHHPWLGDIPGPSVYNPIGDTDSEAFFCALLNALRAKFDHLPTLPVLYEELQKLISKAIDGEEDSTILNFLLGCGQHVQFAYSWPGSRPNSKVWNGLYYTIREPPFKLVRLSDCDISVDFSEMNHEDDRVAVVATYPLTNNEIWIQFEKGQLILFDEGRPHIAAEECDHCEKKGHGLISKVLSKEMQPSLEIDTRHTVGLWGGQDI